MWYMEKRLSENQLTLAQWLAKPPWERSPKTQKELASDLNVTSRTLQLWEKLPEINQLVITLNINKLASLVSPATALLELAIRKPGSVDRVSFDAAKYVVQDWAKRNQVQGDVVQSISDLYKKFHPTEA